MKRVLVLVGALAALVGAGAGGSSFEVLAAAADTGTPFAVGGFQGGVGNQNIGFSAHYTDDGGVVGHLSETLVLSGFPLSTLRGEVDCLVVSGNRAAVGYLVLESSGILALSMPVGSRQTLLVQDNDVEGDTFAFGFFPDCATAISIEPVFPIYLGNIIVSL